MINLWVIKKVTKKLLVEAKQLWLFKERTTRSEMWILLSMGAKELKRRRDVLSSLLNLPVWSSFPSEWERHGLNSWCSVHFPTGLNRISSSPSTSQRGRRTWRAAQASWGRREDCRDITQAVPQGFVAIHRWLREAWSKTALLFSVRAKGAWRSGAGTCLEAFLCYWCKPPTSWT